MCHITLDKKIHLCYTLIMKTNSKEYYGSFKIWNKCGYPCIYINAKDIYLHVYIWELQNGSKPKKYDIHHIDFNKENYNIDNLLLVTLSEHRRYHSGWIRKNNIWVKKPCNKCHSIMKLKYFYYSKTRKIESALCKKCHNEVIIKRNKDPKYRENKLKYYKEYYRRKHGII